ncbi:hypothetical protein [Brevibacillus nitrificans]|nr:hypothetical protein [Brevibacillus nitrificans]MED1793442.1 hypothetical protein [Brevibacillus nitrificans]
MSSSSNLSSPIRLFWMGVVLTALLLVHLPVQAAEKNREVPVKLTVVPGDYELGDEITLEAVTEKMGDSYVVETTEKLGELQVETTLEEGKYVSKMSLMADYIGERTFDYSISMYGDGQEWVGHASVTIRVKDNMPTSMPVANAKFVISPSKNLVVGQKIKFTVTTPYKGGISKEGEFHFFRSSSADSTQKVQQMRTIRRGSVYITTGYFTPKKPGTYLPVYSMIMEDEKTKELWEGFGEYSFEVKENPKITVTLSPNTAYMKAGEDIYLSATYMVQKSPAFSDQLITWNQPGLDKIFGTYDEELGGYRYLYRFHPEKKGTYNLEVTFQMESDGVKREGKAKTKIYVR